MRIFFAALVLTTTLAHPLAAQDNFAAANGPMPGDLGRIMQEMDCVQGLDTPGYFKSMNGAEVADSTRSQLYPCASFLGDWDGPNDVYAWRADGEYQGVLFMNNRHPGNSI